ncbi:MAG: hypothetical protein KDA63_09050 [Planctomycetales bacterium]|nr:hypothetical protein [Planctomycetales bacterium]
MKRRDTYRCVFVQVVIGLVCCSLNVDSAMAQFGGIEQSSSTEAPESESRTFNIQHADAGEVAKFLAQMTAGTGFGTGPTVVADSRNNAIFVKGAPEVLDKVAAMIKQIDTPPEPELLRIFQLQYARVESVSNLLSSILQPTDIRVGVDQVGNRLVVKGTAGKLDEVTALLEKLDTASVQQATPDERREANTVRVRAIWLIAGGETGAMSEPSDDLQPVVDELSALGLNGVRLVGQSIVSTVARGNFSLDGAPVIRAGDTYRSAQLQVAGSLMPPAETSESQLFEVQLKATLTAPEVEMANLRTQLMVPNGHFVVLGTVPFEDMTSIFVIQVTRVD